MSKHWNPAGQSVAKRPSRIRRDPVRIEPLRVLTKAEIEKAENRARELEIWGGVTGILITGIAIAVIAIGVSLATIFFDRPAAALDSDRFEQCYATAGPNCVVDGATIHIHDQNLRIAGIDVPRIQDSACPDERSRGIAAAVRLAALLNSGKVTASREFRDDYGRDVRTVKVNGEDVGVTLIDEGLARLSDGSKVDWCASSSSEAS